MARLQRLVAKKDDLMIHKRGVDLLPHGVVQRLAQIDACQLGPERPESTRALLDGTRDSDRSARHAALTALAALTDPSGEVFDRLMEVITDPSDAQSRKVAAYSLAALTRGLRPRRSSSLVLGPQASDRPRGAGWRRVSIRARLESDSVAVAGSVELANPVCGDDAVGVS